MAGDFKQEIETRKECGEQIEDDMETGAYIGVEVLGSC